MMINIAELASDAHHYHFLTLTPHQRAPKARQTNPTTP